MDSDSNDSMPKMGRLTRDSALYLPGSEAAFLSPVTLQMQRHLLSSTQQGGVLLKGLYNEIRSFRPG
jgi:hypothetical protein